MLVAIIQATGWTLTKLPPRGVQVLVWLLSGAAFFLLGSKRRVMKDGLRQAFPEKGEAWIRQSARKSLGQLFETGAFALAMPFFDEKRLSTSIALSDAGANVLKAALQKHASLILVTPHYFCWEALTLLRKLAPFPMPPCAAMYRPLNIASIDRWAKCSRSAHGFALLDRRKGLRTAIKMLETEGVLGILFDQHTRKDGQMVRFLGREALATRLPAALAHKHNVPLIPAYCRKKGFWNYEVNLDFAVSVRDPSQGTEALNAWLETLILSRPDEAYGWLWAHRRWKADARPASRQTSDAEGA